ncbi:MAG: hypothetical protein WDW36_004930 [Sanguina aurantia]
MSGAQAARASDKEQDRGRVEKAKVQRYWQGKAPDWGTEAQDDEARDAGKERVRTEIAAPVVVRRTDDPRLRRLAASRTTAGEREEVVQRHREIRAAEIVSQRQRPSHEEGDGGFYTGKTNGMSDEDGEDVEAGSREEFERAQARADQADDDGPRRRQHQAQSSRAADTEDDDAASRRRLAVKERLLQQQRGQEEAAAQVAEDEEDEEEADEDEEEESEEEDEGTGRRLLKPIFVAKESRETIAARDRLEAEEAALAEADRKRVEERKLETRAILLERLTMEEAAAKAAAAGPKELEDVDTDEEGDSVEAYESWKGRELRRIKRDHEEKETLEAEAELKEKLKNMTELERALWEKANPKDSVADKGKEKWRYLQKYWHKGAYFQENADDVRGTTGVDSIFARDFSGPTGEDKFDKNLMPAVMQVKNFGRSGRTKYTHLLDQDTTRADDPLFTVLKDEARKRERTTGGAAEFSKPKKFIR